MNMNRVAESTAESVNNVLDNWKQRGAPGAIVQTLEEVDWERQLRRVNDVLPPRYRFLRPKRSRRGWALAAAGVGMGVAGYALYRYAYRPWERSWGATQREARRRMPGDDVIPHAGFQTTRGITIDAPRSEVWPWLVQIGANRGGFYTGSWIDGGPGDRRRENGIQQELQQLEPGDVIRLPRNASISPELELEVREIDPERALVLEADGSTWAFLLEDLRQGHATRLTTRTRADRISGWETLRFLVERGLLLGIKERAEESARHEYAHENPA